MNVRTKLAVAALTVASVAGITTSASAAEETADGLNGSAQVATTPSSDRTTGPQAGLNANRFAVVEADGLLARGKNAFSSAQVSGGTYEVFFDRDVTRCAYVATIGTTGIGTESPGEITVASRYGKSNAVWVDTSNSDGTDGTRAFHLQVIC